MASTYTRTFDHFVLNGALPTGLRVVRTNPPEDATALFSVVADYGWAERILCSGSYRDDAEGIARAIAEQIDVPLAFFSS